MAKKRNLKMWVVMAVFLLGLVLTAGAEIIYVDADASMGGDGQTWGTAYKYLQDALAIAGDGNDIWVAAGTYYPDEDEGANVDPNDRTETFQLINGVAIKGGYAGVGEPDPNERNIELHETILSGDINTAGDNSDNSYHVVTGSGTDATAVLDGFTITAGNANGSNPYDRGGGMYNYAGSPTVTNCTFNGNSAYDGGGMYNYSSTPTVTNCAFIRNKADDDGGGVYNNNENNSIFINCTFIANLAGAGGGMLNEDTENMPLTLVNCTFSNNVAEVVGGGMDNWDSNPTIINCIFWDNKDMDGFGESSQINGGVPQVSYSCIKDDDSNDDYIPFGGIGNNNIDDNPLFVRDPYPGLDGHWDGVNDDFGNLHLRVESPCIDSGTNTTVPPLPPNDYDGNPRILNGIVDIGAYEGPNQAFVISTDTVLVHEGSTASFTVALACDPLGTVEVSVSHFDGDPDITIQSGHILVFDSSDYWIPKTVVLEAQDDNDQLEGSAIVRVTATGIFFGQLIAQEIENDVGPVVFVDCDANGLNNGTSWSNAFNALPDAIDLAASLLYKPDIWVAAGTYQPDEGSGNMPGDREATFQLIKNVALYGSFPTGGGLWEQRDPNLYKTILSGDLNEDDAPIAEPCDLLIEPTRAENSYHVVTAIETDNTALLDGVIITGGYANFPSYHYWGGGIYIIDASPTLNNCTFLENFAINGGGIYNRFTEYTDLLPNPMLSDCNFSRNFASFAGGGMQNDGGKPTIRNCLFIENSSGSAGGGIANYDEDEPHDTNPTLTNCTFIGNSAGSYGGGMINSHSDPTLTDCNFNDNVANRGGGIYISWSNPVLINCIATENDSNDDGGAIYSYHSNPLLSGCTITYNFAQNDGGGICNIYSDPNFNNCVISWNEAVGRGGGIFNRWSSPSLINCKFTANTANSHGGGMHNSTDASPTLTNCNFTSNTTSSSGGGVYNGGNNSIVTFTNCIFERNLALNGGGLQSDDIDSTILIGCIFTRNSVSWGGGGIVLGESGVHILSNCLFIGNIAERGGAVYNSDCHPLFTNCIFSGNSARSSGGAMQLSFRGSPTLVNCIFSGNLAEGLEGGGVMYINDMCTVKLTNCTLAMNSARTGNAFVCDHEPPDDPSHIYITNSILHNGGGEISIYDNSTVTISYSNIQGGWPDANNTNIDADPLFVDANNPDPNLQSFRLQPDSPCIDAGDSTILLAVPIYFDLDDKDRYVDIDFVDDTGYGPLEFLDIGAYEFNCNYTAGDSNCDGVVDFKDLAILAGNWLAGVGD